MALPDQVIYSTQDVGNMRHCNGNPNALKIYGEPGWTCQDWVGGDLYVWGESQGPFQWLPVLTDKGVTPGGTDGQIFTAEGGYTIWSNQITDPSALTVMAWSAYDRELWSDDGNLAVDFSARNLEADGIVSLNWADGISVIDAFDSAAIFANSGSRILADFSTAPSVDWGNRSLKDASNIIALDWHNRYLAKADGALVLGWAGAFPQQFYNPATYSNAALASIGTQTFVPATGATVTPASDTASILTINLNHTATIASLTVALGTWLDKVTDGACITIFARSAVTALTVTAAGGYTLIGTAATTLAAGASIEYVKVGSSRVAVGTAGQVLRVR